jgi:SNF2 family DNA or RNA helicase
MASLEEQFELLVSQRMRRFQLLLDKAEFDFKQYQYDGVEWCIRNELRPDPPGNVRGGFIADEMGLGKTITMIGTMICNFLNKTLIVVPPVLVKQWYKEILRTSGHKTVLYYGLKKKTISIADLDKAHIVLTTYGTLLAPDCLLKRVQWNRAIFDEAHHMRNSKTKRFRSCKEIKARVRWLVTGTPVQNKKQDFYNLCCAANINPENDTTQFVLRRTKASVGIQLPAMVLEPRVVAWTDYTEMMLSEEIHSLIPAQTGVSSEKQQRLAEIWEKGGTLVAMLRAKQSCILPVLMRKTMEMFVRRGLIDKSYLDGLVSTSKLDAIINLILERKDNGRGKIIFCHYREEIDTIADRLKKGGLLKVVCYDGRNSGGKNLALLAEPADALIIQIQTGCEGLNLQEHFSEIYFVSPHWNPRVEDQAIARCHRIGQKEPVSVFKFEMAGFKSEPSCKNEEEQEDPISLEKYINKVQDMKRSFGNEVLGE